jgi:hypothetical protein
VFSRTATVDVVPNSSPTPRMTIALEALRQRVRAQATALPEMYGAIDFDARPERFTIDPADESQLGLALAPQRERLLANDEEVAVIEAFTMLGDAVADAYAALLPELGFQRLVEMLDQACDHGVDAVDGAPPELVALIADMERVPEWLDMELVELGARLDRNLSAHVSPWAIRGAFVATFMNSYAALPMAMTGALGEDMAANRIKETATFFTCTVLPGALERHGPGFKAAAKVRLMHSMVRFNVLRRGKWDSRVYGVPIPQVDQMPAGLLTIFVLALAVVKEGRDFTREERARVELSRYRCFLLGLPEELLPDTPRGIIDALGTRQATLRKAYDDETCGALLRATMKAYLEPDDSMRSRVRDRFERSFSQAFFVKRFLEGDNARAAEIGIGLTGADRARAVGVALMIGGQVAAYQALLRTPRLGDAVDRHVVTKLDRILTRLGHADFASDAAGYRPVHQEAVG